MNYIVLGILVAVLTSGTLAAYLIRAHRRNQKLNTSNVCASCGFEMLNAAFPRCPRCGENT